MTSDPIPATAESITTIEGDWNGDGTADSATTYVLPGDPNDWHVRTATAGVGESDIALGDMGPGYAQVLDRMDVDFSLGVEPGVNHDEFVAIVGYSSSGVLLGFFGVDDSGCGFRFDDGAGDHFIAPVTATIGSRNGLRCEGAMGSQFPVVLRATSADEITYDTTDAKVERTGPTSLSLGTTIPGILNVDDPTLEAYSQAECFDSLLVGGPVDF